MANDFFSYGAPAPVPAAAPAPAAAPVRLLADLGDEDWEKFIGFAAQRRYPAGAAIVRAGERGPALFLVASGNVRVMLPGAAPAIRGEGEVVGLLSFLDGAPHAADVLAVGEVELLMLTPDALTQLAAWQPRIAVALLRDLGAHAAARLRRLQPGD
jgi:CRP/FNR family cyclic AMP-dependent transcriptional regulator